MIKLKLFLILTAIITNIFLAKAQQNGGNSENDSTQAERAKKYASIITDYEQQKIADSIQKADLQLKLQSLSTTDDIEFQKLQQKLKEIDENEDRILEEKKSRIENLRSTTPGYPVLGILKDTIFIFYDKLFNSLLFCNLLCRSRNLSNLFFPIFSILR